MGNSTDNSPNSASRLDVAALIKLVVILIELLTEQLLIKIYEILTYSLKLGHDITNSIDLGLALGPYVMECWTKESVHFVRLGVGINPEGCVVFFVFFII